MYSTAIVVLMMQRQFAMLLVLILSRLDCGKWETKAYPESNWKSDDCRLEIFKCICLPKDFFLDYHRLDKIYDYMDRLENLKPSVVHIVTIGKSVEGRDLRLMKIGSSQTSSKPVIFIDGGIHAREWISPATVLYIADRLVRGNRKCDSLLDNFQWFILPVINPDGYEFSHTHDRLWRKNRSQRNKTCPGVDLNRNWDFHWGEEGSSADPCSEIFRGPEPLCEPETKAMSDFILKQQQTDEKIVSYISFHSYGEYWLTPWGWTDNLPHDFFDMEDIALEAVGAIDDLNGTFYEIGSSGELLGVTSGASDDWVKAVAKVKYSYTVELPDYGKYGFVLPKEHIMKVVLEMWEAIKSFAEALKEKV